MARRGTSIGPWGSYAFLVGIVIAVLAGLFAPGNDMAVGVLAVLGVLVGLVNITAEETQGFLVAAIALVVSAGSLGALPVLGNMVTSVLNYVVAIVAPAAVIVALLHAYKLARS